MKIELLSRIPDQIRHETPILFVHGAWHGAWCWQPHFMPYFADQGYAVYAVSLRGHGNSDGRSSVRWHRIKDYVEDLGNAVARMPRRPVLVGHSMGGLGRKSSRNVARRPARAGDAPPRPAGW